MAKNNSENGTIETRVTSSHWGAMEIDVQNGQIIAARPFHKDPNPSGIPAVVPAAVHHELRVKQPSIRRAWLNNRDRAGRGDGDYVELPWDEALDIAAAEIDRIRQEHGNQAIYGGSYGWSSAGRFHHAQSQVHRFLNKIGGYVSSFGSYSTGCAQAIMPHVLGMPFLQYTYDCQESWQSIGENADTIVMFGGINTKNAQVSMGGVTEHDTADWFAKYADKGIRFINIGPQRSDGIAGSEWIPCKPAGDTALMLALAHVLESEGLSDRDFLNKYTTGFERFRPYLMGEHDGIAKTPDWAVPLCGVDADTIRDLARRMARGRTMITTAWSLQRAEHGEQPYWMSAVLGAMIGQIGLPGRGIGYGYGAIGGIGKAMKPMRGMTFDQGQNPIKDFIPVARIGDMLRNPGGRYEFNGETKTYPDIKLIYWAGGNPYHHHQDLKELHKAWQHPDCVIVNEPWWTATAKRADIVFPATTPYEREDIGRSGMDNYLFHMPALVPPQYGARDDYDIFWGLAQRLQAGEAFSEGRSSGDWLGHLYQSYVEKAQSAGIDVPDLDELRDRNWVELPIVQKEYVPTLLAKFREDPEANPLGTPSGKIEIFSETIAGFGYADCAGHPKWLPPSEWMGSADEQAPLHMVSPQPGDKLHSQLEAALQDNEGARPETLVINAVDATARNISSGDLVRVFNSRGACRARAKVSDDILQGVVALPTGAWFGDAQDNIDQNGNPNVLTLDVGTSQLGQGCSAHTALVNVELLTG
ncbi:molybdopterin-dependent oxidoreductase [Tropicibacter sp. R15_0]|uniref:molybdopterin-dependent oxidoreductase n=1 Tax=Tropicibacter sp. R15_0 TaxID=2821101 RepID=UPI001ADBEC86|nr:molybdopterin-dependent oxidoreductase [Tropicibacter sp. R15_0]MBO9464620.1 molybdopterin-dependent oxidoreductase [Tropicibacter sp. R15_0]